MIIWEILPKMGIWSLFFIFIYLWSFPAVKQDQRRLLSSLAENEGKFNDSCHWPPWVAEKALVTANISNSDNKGGSGPQQYHSNCCAGRETVCFSYMGLNCAASADGAFFMER